MIMKYQQGDVVMYKVDDKTFQANCKQGNDHVVKYNGRTHTNAILAFGEVTGHTHRVNMAEMAKEAGVTLHMGWNREAGQDVPEGFEVSGETVTLVHEEHNPVKVPPGKYIVRIVREFNHITRRAQYVAD